MPVSNQTIGGTGVAGGTWTIENTNTASVGRYHDLALLVESTSSFTQARPGIFSGYANSGAPVAAAYASAATGSGLNANVYPGAAVVERGTHVGPYIVVLDATGTITFATADATNPRIDRVDLQVLDGVLGDNGGTSLTQLIVTTGVAAGSPSVPAAPVNSIPIFQILLPANTTTLTNGMITDARKSTALRGTTRVLLPGDALTDVGYTIGESRMRYNSTYGWLEDYWDSVAGIWRGTQIIPGVAQTWGNGTSDITLTGNPTYNTIITCAVADPGWPYKLRVSAKGRVDYTSSWSSSSWNPPFATFQLGLDSIGDFSVGVANTWPPLSTSAVAYWGAVESTDTVKLTGAHTVYFSVNGQGGGGSASMKYTFFEGNASRTSTQIGLSVDIIPAGT